MAVSGKPKRMGGCLHHVPTVALLTKSSMQAKLDSWLPATRGGIPFFEHQNICVKLQPWSNLIFSIASQHDLDIGHQGPLGQTRKTAGTAENTAANKLSFVTSRIPD